MNDPVFTGCETGPFEDPRDNFHYHNHLTPRQQYKVWIHQWKKQHWEIHQACKDLGLETHTDEYLKRLMDGVSMKPSKSPNLNIDVMDEEVDMQVGDIIMSSNQGT